MNQLELRPGRRGQRIEISGVRRQDQVTVHAEQDERRVDDVVISGATQQSSGTAAERVIKRDDRYGIKQPCA